MLLNRPRANRIMDENGLDGLVAAFPENIYYLSDYWGSMLLMSRNYTLYAFVPRDESQAAALIMPGSGVYHLEHTPTWMPRVATYVTRLRPDAPLPPRDYETTTEEIIDPPPPALMPYPVRPGVAMQPRDVTLLDRYAMHSPPAGRTAFEALRTAIADAGCGSGRLGFDDPRVLGWLQGAGLPELTGIDALNVFKRIRMVKSADELTLIRQSATIAESALDEVIERMEVGMPLAHIDRLHAEAMVARGGRSEWIIANIRGLATGNIEKDELIKIDSVGSVAQYRGDVGRSVYFGTPDAEMLARSEAVSKALEMAYMFIRPGRTFKEVTEHTLDAVRDAGFPGFVIASPHSVGLEHTDHPVSVGPEMPGAHELVFEENMVFTLDMPYHEFGWGTTHVEDMMLVTASGCEALTSTDTRLRVKPA